MWGYVAHLLVRILLVQVMMSLTHGTAVGLPGRVPVDLRPSHAPAATRATRRSEDKD